MAAQNQPRPSRLLSVVAVVLIGMYAAVALGTTHAPKLGLDLRGGTAVILKAVPPPGTSVTKGALSKAVSIIRQRVDTLGVSESQVTTQGSDTISVEVPGKNRDKVVALVGTTAQLRFRQVLQIATGSVAPAASPTPSPTSGPSAHPTAKASVKPATSAKPSASTTRHRPLSAALLASGAASPSPLLSPSPSPSPVSADTTVGANDAAARAQFATLDCAKTPNPTGGNDTPQQEIVACDDPSSSGVSGLKYLLSPSAVVGSMVTKAAANLSPTTGQWEVDLTFDGTGSRLWAAQTTRVSKLTNPYSGGACGPPVGCNAIAIVLDGLVESAPTITQPIVGGQAQISGNFTQARAQSLTNVLKYGALPLKFDVQSVNDVSATLGRDQLHGGLIAGLIGLALVVLYSLLYYRGLGLVTVASLVLSGTLLYAATTLLGTALSYTLSLAGIAGFIVAVGITADSFVVFFERIRDEVREARSGTFRSAVERAWPRARRTIISADTVSLLAAVVLYFFAIGNVRGFAFTLGLSTLSDLFIVFLFTKPMLTVLARSRAFSSGAAWTGVGRMRLGGAALAGPAVVKEA